MTGLPQRPPSPEERPARDLAEDASSAEQMMKEPAEPPPSKIQSFSLASDQAEFGTPEPETRMFERPDFTAFRSLATLPQKAGVPLADLAHLIAKELADNGLDTGARVTVGLLGTTGFFVEDDGPGIPGGPEAVAELFSLRRPMTSSKLLRLPTRGALGNGLRVVTGAVLASGGELRVRTRGQFLRLMPQDDGTTQFEVIGESAELGTRVEVVLGERVPVPENVLSWAQGALLLAGRGTQYKGKSSPHWYDADAFYELFQAAGTATVRDLVSRLDGCSGEAAADIVEGYQGRRASSLDRREVVEVLARAQDRARQVLPRRLGAVGALPGPGKATRVEGTFSPPGRGGGLPAKIPFVVEAWASRTDRRSMVLFVNRTPTIPKVMVFQNPKQRTDTVIYGYGLAVSIPTGQASMTLAVNITTPFMPITSDGKEPDLSPFRASVTTALTKAARLARRDGRVAQGKVSHKAATLACLDEANEKASGGGRLRVAQRQLFYALRPLTKSMTGEELSYQNLEKILTELESQRGPIRGMYRDSRGILYMPHGGGEIPVGTLSVERYVRPAFTFSKLLYIEKEGLFQVLIAAKWPERHDCALLTSKGYASRAVRDLIDLLVDPTPDNSEEVEPITIFAIHDADGPGTMIFESLQEATAARPGRKCRIVNLGLEPDEAMAMELEPESFTRKGKVAVAPYVDEYWRRWLQSNRVELNAMTSPQLLDWLDEKIAPYEDGKLIPPQPYLDNEIDASVSKLVEQELTKTILETAGIGERKAEAAEVLRPAMGDCIKTAAGAIKEALEKDPTLHWRAVARDLAESLVKSNREAIVGVLRPPEGSTS
jgi:hypothetical protein